MPTVVRAFSCAFGCGRGVLMNRLGMVRHEARCFHNPARRACQTCANFKAEYDTVYVPHFDKSVGDNDYEVKRSYCETREDVDLEKQLQHDCPNWQPITPPISHPAK